MEIVYSDETQTHEISGKGTMLLSKNEYGIKLDNVKGFIFHDITVIGQHKGKIKQLYHAFKFIYGLGKYKGNKNVQ